MFIDTSKNGQGRFRGPRCANHTEDQDVVILISAYYALEEMYPGMQKYRTGPRPMASQESLHMVFEQVRRLPRLAQMES